MHWVGVFATTVFHSLLDLDVFVPRFVVTSLIFHFVYLSLHVSIFSWLPRYTEPFIHKIDLFISSALSLFTEEYVPFSLLSFCLVLTSR